MTKHAKDRVCLGAVAGAHGVKGLVKLKSFTEVAQDIAAYGPLEDEPGTRHFKLEVLGRVKGAVLARMEGVADRNAADALRGTRLYVDRDKLPAAEDGEFYHADLIGLTVERVDGTPVGTVQSVQDFGAGDLLEVAPVERGAQTILVPFDAVTVPVVDLAAGRVVIDPPPGLLDPTPDDQDGADEVDGTDEVGEGENEDQA
jgi:16S rRNA processing protein RimM